MGIFDFGKKDESWMEEIFSPYDIAKVLYISKKYHAMSTLINYNLDKYLNIRSNKCGKMKVIHHIIVMLFPLILFSSCGLVWQKQKKELVEKLFKEYPTMAGDIPHEPVNRSCYDREQGRCVEDTVLIVKNGDKYFQIDKKGNRTEVKYYRKQR